jgi:excisionase family DNA binding protein
MDNKQKWLTVRTVSEALGVSDRTVYRMASQGALVAVKFRGSVRILAISVRHYEIASRAAYQLDNGLELLEKDIEKLEEDDFF